MKDATREHTATCPGSAVGINPVLIGIGANLPGRSGRDALGTCRWAARRLGAVPGLRLVALSRWFRSRPVLDHAQPDGGQPDYVNGVAHLMGRIDPARLLAALQAIEAEAGRVRSVPNAARTLDLDIVAMGQLVREAPDPVLPHPRMHLRSFVLAPLVDVCPGWWHPILQQTATELLSRDFPGQAAMPIGLHERPPTLI